MILFLSQSLVNRVPTAHVQAGPHLLNREYNWGFGQTHGIWMLCRSGKPVCVRFACKLYDFYPICACYIYQQVATQCLLDDLPHCVLTIIAQFCNVESKCMLSCVSQHCNDIVEQPSLWRMLYLGDDDHTDMSFAYVKRQSAMPHMLIINQPNTQRTTKMLKFECYVVPSFVNVTYLHVMATLTTTLSWVSKLPNLSRLVLVSSPNVNVDTFIEATRFAHKLTDCDMRGLHHMRESQVVDLAKVTKNQVKFLHVPTVLQPATVSEILDLMDMLTELDFKPAPVRCASQWLTVLTDTNVAKLSHQAIREFKNSDLL